MYEKIFDGGFELDDRSKKIISAVVLVLFVLLLIVMIVLGVILFGSDGFEDAFTKTVYFAGGGMTSDISKKVAHEWAGYVTDADGTTTFYPETKVGADPGAMSKWTVVNDTPDYVRLYGWGYADGAEPQSNYFVAEVPPKKSISWKKSYKDNIKGAKLYPLFAGQYAKAYFINPITKADDAAFNFNMPEHPNRDVTLTFSDFANVRIKYDE